MGAESAWYAGTLSAFVEAGYIQPQDFSPAATATRGNFLDLLLRLKGGVVHGPFSATTFDDISADDPRFFVFEEAAAQGWVRGAGDCCGSHPCSAFPRRTINRAEAAALLVRAFGLTAQTSAPTFRDMESEAWYVEPLRIASSHCIFQGDDGGGTVRPADTLNQAEMLAVLYRTLQGLSYPECSGEGQPLPLAPASLQMQLPLPTLPNNMASSAAASTSLSSADSAFSRSSSLTSAAFSSFSSSASFISSSVFSLSSNVLSAIPDPDYAVFLSKYDQYITLFGSSLEETKSVENSATVQVLNLLKAQMDIITAFYQYVAIARQRTLTDGERQVTLSLMVTIEKGFANIQSIQSVGA
ncbi:MAG: hypothetical protein PHX87_03870 [Candidatus Peribacteraceae bacterium]|nr:hypothetical protein [Candidatus Peribacteraceae bacterium]MDD5742541.1 hypothetical protein [Candidatus Peribacteraceae bacterium]